MTQDQQQAEQATDGARVPLRDHVHVGLDVPIRVYKKPASADYPGKTEWWYYIHVEIPSGGGGCVGLVERRERKDGGFFWAGLAEPGYGTVCWEASQQDAVDALVRYALERNVRFRKELREERIV